VKFFLDTADIAEIEEACSWGVLSGVTTNPTLYSRVGGKLSGFHEHVKRICEIVDGPVSAETVSLKRDEIVAEGLELAALHECVVVKVPVMPEGLAATKQLFEHGVHVNMTLCFTVPQAIMSARAGASYVSPFVGRFDDISEDGIEHLGNMIDAMNNYDFGHKVEVIAASIRSAHHVTQAALLGADIATVPFAVLKNIVKHPLTDRGLESFLADWEKVKNS
jgi:transaldolase